MPRGAKGEWVRKSGYNAICKYCDYEMTGSSPKHRILVMKLHLKKCKRIHDENDEEAQKKKDERIKKKTNENFSVKDKSIAEIRRSE